MTKRRLVEPSSDLERYRRLLSPQDFERLLQELARPLPSGLRANPLKVDLAKAAVNWPEWYGWQMQPVPFCPAGWTLAAAGERPALTSEYKHGFYYLQDAASMLPAELFSFEGLPEPLILDMAAAPGGKSTHLASRSGDRGLLVANDSSFGRIPALQTALTDWGAMNSLVTNHPGERFGDWFPDSFDLVLVDAPCSMDNLRPGEGHSRRSVSDRERQNLAGRQVNLLSSAVAAARPGGQVVYSTCTLAPEENEGVVDAVLRRYPGLLRLDEPQTGQALQAPGLAKAAGQSYAPGMHNSVRLWPHLLGTSGFFAARLTKLDQSASRPEAPPVRSFSRLGFEPLVKDRQKAALDHILQTYGFNLEPVLEGQDLSLWKHENHVLVLPAVYLHHFASFPVLPPGFPLYEDTRDGLIISHELAARFGMHFSLSRLTLDPADRHAWLRGSDLPFQERPGMHVNSIVIVVDEKGRLLGRGKVLRDRLKNMLPRRLALRS